MWYNYVVASAGTITGVDNTITATESICPKGWTLPNRRQINADFDIANFTPALGGIYNNGSLDNKDTNGTWWSSTALNGAARRYIRYDGSKLYTTLYGRYIGTYIRCVSEEKDVSDLTYMQDMTLS